MKYLTDHGLLMIYCCLSVLFLPISTAFIATFFIVLSYCTVTYVITDRRICWFFSLIYCILIFFFPIMIIFMPVFSYHIFLEHDYYFFAIGLGSTIYYFHQMPREIWVLLAFGCFISFLLQKRTTEYELLEEKFKHTRDDSTELNLLLKEKNHDLLEKQDYEIYTATLKERNRIAREIHDNVGHMLTRSILMIGALKAINQQEQLNSPLDTMESTLTSAMDSVRMSVHDLHDESVNLKEAIDSLINDFTFCPISLEYDMSYSQPKEVKYSFIAITKEALTNIAKHSNATAVHILIREHPALYQISINDNGTITSDLKNKGIGLINIQERVSSLKGNVQFLTGNGFKVFITIPKNHKHESI